METVTSATSDLLKRCNNSGASPWCSKPCIEAFGGGGLVLDLTKRETVASIDCADWLAHHMTDPGELAEHRQREATRENGPQSE